MSLLMQEFISMVKKSNKGKTKKENQPKGNKQRYGYEDATEQEPSSSVCFL
ncbi:hypothetical protein Hanom_Chr09g00785701 [Helianthus anomalus]